MNPRPALVALLLFAGDGPVADPFEAALLGRTGPDAVAAPPGDPALAAVSWTAAPRHWIVDGLAARILRGDVPPPAGTAPSLTLPAPPSRVPAGFVPPNAFARDPLAWWIPADTAAVFFASLKEAWDTVAALKEFLPRALPGPCGEPPGGDREALRRALDLLLLPSIWNANPGVKTGVRSVALVVSDPEVRYGPDIALVFEVDDASLLLAQRKATFGWEDRTRPRFRVEGLDCWTDDGSVRSFFALEGGTAVFATTRSLRDRVLAAGSGKAPSFGTGRDYPLARTTFPRGEGGVLLVVPDAFLARVNSVGMRLRRAARLRCEAARLILDARVVGKQPLHSGPRLECPCGGVLRPGPEGTGASCSIHGTAVSPAPLGDSLDVRPRTEDAEVIERLFPGGDVVISGAVPVALVHRFSAEAHLVEILVPEDEPSTPYVFRFLTHWFLGARGALGEGEGPLPGTRRQALLGIPGFPGARADAAIERLTGLRRRNGDAPPADIRVENSPGKKSPSPDPESRGGVFRVRVAATGSPVTISVERR